MGDAAPQIRKIRHVQCVALGGQAEHRFAQAGQRIATACAETRPRVLASRQRRAQRVDGRLQRHDVNFSRHSLRHQHVELVQRLHAVYQRMTTLRACHLIQHLTPQAICHASRAFNKSSHL